MNDSSPAAQFRLRGFCSPYRLDDFALHIDWIGTEKRVGFSNIFMKIFHKDF